MAKIPRRTALQFGASYLGAPTGQIAQFGSVRTGIPVYSGDPAVIQSLAAWLSAWSAAVVANPGGNNQPTLEEMNGVLACLSYFTMYQQQESILEWDADTIYFQGSWAKATDGSGAPYISKTDNNQDNALSDTNNWAPFIQNLGGNSLCKAWVSFDGRVYPNCTIKSSFNVQQVAHLGVGVYLITFSPVLPNANYCFSGAVGTANGVASPGSPGVDAGPDSAHLCAGFPGFTGIRTVNQLLIFSYSDDTSFNQGALRDSGLIDVQIFGPSS